VITVEPVLTLRPGRERSVLRGHPWLFSGSVAGVSGDVSPGVTVVVRDTTGVVLGRAAYSPDSQLCARMWTFDESTIVDEAFVAQRIAAAAARRDALGLGCDATRLVFSEADGVPGLVADRYNDTVVVQLTTTGADRWREVIADALVGLPGVKRVYERSDADNRRREGLDERVGLLRGDPIQGRTTVSQGPWRFLVDVATGHKTGFYIDQRNSRAALAPLCAGRDVLNTFAYTGAFSVVAAHGGAASVTHLDSSVPALALAAENLALNDLDPGITIEADAFSELRRMRDRRASYDLIIVDPPKLAASAKQVDRATRAYKDLNLLALKLLRPGGILMTFSCSGSVSSDLFQKVVAGAAVDAGREARIIGRLTQPADHPVPLSFPEADYLKGLVVEVA
jgi:23S rRNA (cytosine1962-C5)-methyltransferase